MSLPQPDEFVAFHSLQSSLSQLPVTLVNLALIVWLVRIIIPDLHFPAGLTVLLFFMILVNILCVVISVIALVKDSKGRFYYGPNAVSLSRPVEPNKPPEGI